MKDLIIPVVIVLAVIAASVLYGNKTNREQDDIDKIHVAFDGIHKIVRPDSRLSFGYAGMDGGTASMIHMWSRYELVPAYVSFEQKPYDTMLTVCIAGRADSFLAAIATVKKLLWQGSNGQYSYFLTSSK